MGHDIKGILFDKDGVLFDFQRTWGGWAHRMIGILSEGDAGLAQRLADVMVFDMPSRRFHPGSFVIAGTSREVSEAVATVLPGRSVEAVHKVMTTEAARTPLVEAVPLRATLSALGARGLPLGLATNDTEASARAHLGASEVLDLFAFVAGSDSGHGAKPAPGMCTAFAKAQGLEPEALVMVGDSTHDMAAGRAAGFVCVAVLTGVAVAEDLAPHADAVLPDIAALGDWLDGRGRGGA